MRRTLSILSIALLPLGALAACGGDDAGDPEVESSSCEATPGDEVLDGVEVAEAEAEGGAPTLEFDQPLEVEETAVRVVDEGDGDRVEDGATVIFDFVFVNGRDGTELGGSYEADPAEISFDDTLLPGVYKGLTCQQAGSRVLVGMAPADGLGADETTGVLEDDTILLLADIREVRFPLERAEGEAVEPAEGLPTVELDDDGAPTITIPDEPAPTELVVQPLIEGDGPVVEEGDTITVHYTGMTYADGEVFDSSWTSGTPASFPIGVGEVITGWDKGLVGQAVGSQVLLVIPPADGYGATGRGETIPPDATLVFVIDILDTRPSAG